MKWLPVVLFCSVAFANAAHGKRLTSIEDPAVTAIVGATVIDGNGGPALPEAVIVIRGKRIVAVGPRASVKVPSRARVIAAEGAFITPGFIDTNVHLSILSYSESMVRYWPLHKEAILETAQVMLKHGVTTVRDSYGVLEPLLQVRDAIARGESIGPRMLVAGNIVGWGGPGSYTFNGPGSLYYDGKLESTRPLRAMKLWKVLQAAITQGVGEELIPMSPDDLRVAINKYLDTGVDFIKYGGTIHGDLALTWPVFSPRQQAVIVEETHKRGKVVETHAGGEEARLLALQAGIDLMQHPEANGSVSDEILRLLVDRKVICSLHAGNVFPIRTAEELEAKKNRPQRTDQEPDKRPAWQRLDRIERSKKIIESGCIVSVATDSQLPSDAEEFLPDGEKRKPGERSPGTGTLHAIESLVKLGMTPAQAIVAATKHGAMACRALTDYGTLEAGKYADLLILDADPLADIGNIRQLRLVMKEGAVIDIGKLPVNPVWGVEPSAAGH